MPPVVQLTVVVETHSRLDPAQPLLEPEFPQVLEGSRVRRADEVVIALDPSTGEVDVRRHATDAIVTFEQRDSCSSLRKLVRRGQTHGTGADDCDFAGCVTAHLTQVAPRAHKERRGGWSSPLAWANTAGPGHDRLISRRASDAGRWPDSTRPASIDSTNVKDRRHSVTMTYMFGRHQQSRFHELAIRAPLCEMPSTRMQS